MKRFYNENDQTIPNEEGLFVRKDDGGRLMLYIKDEYGGEMALTYYKSGLLLALFK